MRTTEEIREDVLNSAWKRFGHFGYNKTTMAEIAHDCGMSAANLYRYFNNKSTIGAGIAKRYFDKESELISEVVKRTDLTPREKLEEVVLASVRYNFTEFENTPAIMELIDHICRDGQNLISDHKSKVVAEIVNVLAEGNLSMDFNVTDTEETAVAIRLATIPFHVTPVFLKLINAGRSKDEMECMARGVIKLITKGIAKR